MTGHTALEQQALPVTARWSLTLYQSFCQLAVKMTVTQAYKASFPARRVVFKLSRTLRNQTQLSSTPEQTHRNQVQLLSTSVRTHQAYLTPPKQ